MGDVLKKWVAKRMSSFILTGAKFVSEEVFEKRMDACNSCEHKGKVMPVPGFSMDGCTLCGCPFITKNRVEILMRDPKNVGRPLTASELVKSPFGGSYVPDTVRCSDHEKNDRWSNISSV